MDDVTAERWLPVVGFKGLYDVSDRGHVRSLPRMTSSGVRGGRILKTPLGPHGYPVATLWSNGNGHTRTVHSLVAEAFLGPRPEGHEVRHNDGDRTNCALSNLLYGTHSENEQDKLRHGTQYNAAKTECPAGHNPDGKRGCVECPREHQRAYAERQRAKRLASSD